MAMMIKITETLQEPQNIDNDIIIIVIVMKVMVLMLIMIMMMMIIIPLYHSHTYYKNVLCSYQWLISKHRSSKHL